MSLKDDDDDDNPYKVNGSTRASDNFMHARFTMDTQ